MKTFKRWISSLLIVSMMAIGVPMPASAAIVSTDQLAAGAEREQVRSFLDRAEVRTRLQSMGVDADAARARVDALSDQEAKDLAGKIDQLPAGGDILGVVFLIFIILLVTDILGLTKVFPFTRSMR